MVAVLHNRREHIAIAGSGIIGISCALALIQRGYRVTLIDRDEPASACSFGNAGMTWCPWVAPLARPDIIKRVPGMLMRPDSPLTIRSSYAHHGLGWMRRVIKESKSDRIATSSAALAELIKAAPAATQQMVETSGSQDLMRHDGWVEVYRHDSNFKADAHERELQAAHGVAGEAIGADELRELAPTISDSFKHGVWNSKVSNTRDPEALAKRFFDTFVERGGSYVRSEIHSVAFDEKGQPIFVTADAPVRADKIVIALGAWSAPLVEQLDGKIPLAAERGYHSVCPDPGVELPRPVVFKEAGVVATPMNAGIRLAGLDEFARVNAPANPKMIDRIRKAGSRNLPGLSTQGATSWMGPRPALPDSLPVISPSVSSDRVVYAFGHHHLGLICGPITGDLVAALIARDTPSVNLSPFRVQRLWSV